MDDPMIPAAPSPWDRRISLGLSLVFLLMGLRGCLGQREGLQRMERIEEQNKEIKALLMEQRTPKK